MRKIIVIGALLLGLSACSGHQKETADLIYTNGKIYTLNSENPWAEAFAIKDKQFLAVGDAKSMLQYQGRDTRTIDLNSKMVLPGLIDDHIHPETAVENLMGIHLLPSKMNWDQQAKIITDRAREIEGNGWILGGALNWLNDNGDNMLGTNIPSHFSTLDKLVDHRPLMLLDIGAHAALLNSKAMAIMNITAASESPGRSCHRRCAD